MAEDLGRVVGRRLAAQSRLISSSIATFKPAPAGGSPKPSVYKLPQIFSYGQCHLQLDLNQETRVADEQSTWVSIGLAATQLLQACGTDSGMTGGWIRTGDNDHLLVTVGNLFGNDVNGELASNLTVGTTVPSVDTAKS